MTDERAWTREPTTEQDHVLDTRSLRALAHPVRVKIIGILRRDGAATASQLATRLDLNSGATSYHLRQLAGAGLIVEDETRGNRRERWWKAVYRSTYFDASAYDADPDAAMAYLNAVAVQYADRILAGTSTLPVLPEGWFDAATMSDFSLRITPDEARELLTELLDVVARYRRDGASADAPAGSERVVVQLQVLPELAPEGTDPSAEPEG
ncbi:MAG TPA: helix-turn-helix domain-containing protein [Nocardioidaceae bacterium]|jgi:DNA-binding transcriptional ArsR family regulator|nr:helix-turn-helix domain-containing protein [Nocardioidaceae bacterium]